jgi:hypothetical protein
MSKTQHITGFIDPQYTPKMDSFQRRIVYAKNGDVLRIELGKEISEKPDLHVKVKAAVACEDKYELEDTKGRSINITPLTRGRNLRIDNQNFGSLKSGTYCLQIWSKSEVVREYILTVIEIE